MFIMFYVKKIYIYSATFSHVTDFPNLYKNDNYKNIKCSCLQNGESTYRYIFM